MFKRDERVEFIKDHEVEIMGSIGIVPKGTKAHVIADNHICVYVEFDNFKLPILKLVNTCDTEMSLYKDDCIPNKIIKTIDK